MSFARYMLSCKVPACRVALPNSSATAQILDVHGQDATAWAGREVAGGPERRTMRLGIPASRPKAVGMVLPAGGQAIATLRACVTIRESQGKTSSCGSESKGKGSKMPIVMRALHLTMPSVACVRKNSRIQDIDNESACAGRG